MIELPAQRPVAFFRAVVGKAQLTGRRARRRQGGDRPVLAAEPARIVRLREEPLDVVGETTGKRTPRAQPAVTRDEATGELVKVMVEHSDPVTRKRLIVDLVLHDGTVVLDAPHGQRVGGWVPAPADGAFGQACRDLVDTPLADDLDAEHELQRVARKAAARARRNLGNPEAAAKLAREEAAERTRKAAEERRLLEAAAADAAERSLALAALILREEGPTDRRVEDLPLVHQVFVVGGEDAAREQARQIAESRKPPVAEG